MFGVTSLPFLSYEAAFLYQIAIDFQLTAPMPLEAVTCCRLRRIRPDVAVDERFGSFAAAFGLVLAGVKLKDDLKDRKGWIPRVLWWKYRKQVDRAKRHFEIVAPGLIQRLQACVEQHSALEAAEVRPSLEQTLKPSGEGFSLVFRAVADVFAGPGANGNLSDLGDVFSQIGRHIGQALIAWDCAVDYESDKVHGQFTPLNSTDDVAWAFDVCRRELAAAAWLCPVTSVSRSVISGVLQKVQTRQRSVASVCSATRLERWGLIRQKGYAYARCDGCEVLCIGAECLNCCAAGTDLGVCFAPNFGCCNTTPAKVSSGSPATTSEKAETTPTSSQYPMWIGRDAVTDGALSPVGFVWIDGRRVPAKLKSGDFLASQSNVRVVSVDEFGLTVVRH